MAEFREFPTNFHVIIDLTVEYNDRVAVSGDNGLVAGFEINNFQARGTHRAGGRFEYALLVRPAMNQQSRGLANALGIGNPIFMSKSGDAAQIPESPRSPCARSALQRKDRPQRPLLPISTSITPTQTRATPAHRS